MNTKKKHGPGSASLTKRSEKEELGKAIKRKVINRAKDEESLEEIKEYTFDEDPLTDALVSTGLMDRYDDYEPLNSDYRKYV